MHLLISYELLFDILSALFVVILLTFYVKFYLLFIEILLIFTLSNVDASHFTCFIYRENINILLRFCAIKHLHFTNISCTLPLRFCVVLLVYILQTFHALCFRSLFTKIIWRFYVYGFTEIFSPVIFIKKVKRFYRHLLFLA